MELYHDGCRITAMDQEEVTRRDHLAKHRTHLANERTFLSYVRTALSCMVLGVGLIHFLSDPVSQSLGWISLGAGIIVLAVGFWRFDIKRRNIEVQ